MRRLLTGALLGCLLALAGVVVTQLPAQACSCVAGQTLSTQAERATDVLLGSVGAASTQDPTAGSATYDVAVERVFKGRAQATLTLRTPASSASCGVDLVADRRYLLLGTRQGNVVEVNLCGGTRVARDPAVERVVALLGAGREPAAQPSEPVTPTFESLDDQDAPTFARLAAPGAAVALVGLLGLLLVRRVGRPH